MNRIFDGRCMPCLRMYLKSARAFLIKKDDCLAVHHSILRAAKRKHVDANIRRVSP